MNRLASLKAGIVMTCTRNAVFQAGEEICAHEAWRRNSFKSSWQPNRNSIWTRRARAGRAGGLYVSLLALRRKIDAQVDASQTVKTFFREPDRVTGWKFTRMASPRSRLLQSMEEACAKLPEGNWKLLCDGKRCAEDR